ncbi:hypothetical protein ACETAC_06845 [Aceticella autotrophica]|uniref:Uncharacterized protein n=1 Tax=Aceticella autotrophica TaxID=2755338 RepID=A0A975AUD8_9THEO|nr:hypothetical protein [Aceticella autotrophica]QSZ26627.1 hypothetical protein ACETAC_06845 [Aceticella autotrophica]
MQRSNYAVGIAAILIITLLLTIGVLIKDSLTLLTFTLLTILGPLVTVAIISFINGLLNPTRLIKVIGFNIIIVLAIEIIMLFFNPVFSSKEFIDRLNSMSQNSAVQIHISGVGNLISGLFIFIIIAVLFSFIGSKIGKFIKKSY